MNYPFILKFSGISNLSDARYAAGAWADFIGFCFDPSQPDYLEPAKAKEITGWINGPMFTGEFGQQPIEWIQDFVNALSLQAIQVPADYQDMRIFDQGLKVIVKADKKEQTKVIDKADILVAASKEVYTYLKSISEVPVILSFTEAGLKAGDYDGIELKGVMEEKPGTRNHGVWNEILEPYFG